MKELGLFLILLLLVLLSGCINEDAYNFSGSSQNWEVFYLVENSNDTIHLTNGTFKYVGEEPVPKAINYEVETQYVFAQGSNITTEDGMGNLDNGSCKDCAVVQGNGVITVRIFWNEKMEDVILKNEK